MQVRAATGRIRISPKDHRGWRNTLEHAATLEGEPITWARLYDLGMTLMFLGRGRKMREKILDLALLKDGEGFLDVGSGPGELVIAACERVGTLG